MDNLTKTIDNLVSELTAEILDQNKIEDYFNYKTTRKENKRLVALQQIEAYKKRKEEEERLMWLQKRTL